MQRKVVSSEASEAARALVRKRWDNATDEQRKAQGAALAAGRRRAARERERRDPEQSE